MTLFTILLHLVALNSRAAQDDWPTMPKPLPTAGIDASVGLTGFGGTTIQPQIYVPLTACSANAQKLLREVKSRNQSLWTDLSTSWRKNLWQTKYRALETWIERELSPCERKHELPQKCRQITLGLKGIKTLAATAGRRPLTDSEEAKWRQLEIEIKDHELSILPEVRREILNLRQEFEPFYLRAKKNSAETKTTLLAEDDCPEVVRQYLDHEAALLGFTARNQRGISKSFEQVLEQERSWQRSKASSESALQKVGRDPRTFKRVLVERAK